MLFAFLDGITLAFMCFKDVLNRTFAVILNRDIQACQGLQLLIREKPQLMFLSKVLICHGGTKV